MKKSLRTDVGYKSGGSSDVPNSGSETEKEPHHARSTTEEKKKPPKKKLDARTEEVLLIFADKLVESSKLGGTTKATFFANLHRKQLETLWREVVRPPPPAGPKKETSKLGETEQQHVPVKPEFINWLTRIGIAPQVGRNLIPLFEPTVQLVESTATRKDKDRSTATTTVVSKAKFLHLIAGTLLELINEVEKRSANAVSLLKRTRSVEQLQREAKAEAEKEVARHSVSKLLPEAKAGHDDRAIAKLEQLQRLMKTEDEKKIESVQEQLLSELKALKEENSNVHKENTQLTNRLNDVLRITSNNTDAIPHNNQPTTSAAAAAAASRSESLSYPSFRYPTIGDGAILQEIDRLRADLSRTKEQLREETKRTQEKEKELKKRQGEMEETRLLAEAMKREKDSQEATVRELRQSLDLLQEDMRTRTMRYEQELRKENEKILHHESKMATVSRLHAILPKNLILRSFADHDEHYAE